MSGEKEYISIIINEKDNVAVIVESGGLKEGSLLKNGIRLVEYIPQGHKVALYDMKEGDAIIRYGEVIGYVTKDIPKGSWINESITKMPEAPDISKYVFDIKDVKEPEPLEGYTFEGYKDDQCVITRHKGNATSFHYNIHSPKEALKHHETYDVYRIIVEKKDQFDNTVPYASDVFSIEAKGSIDIIGPKQRSLIHGATAFWIKSIKTGKGTLTLMFNDQKITKEVHVNGVDIKG